jgi:Secretion system C-terminal sorting domain
MKKLYILFAFVLFATVVAEAQADSVNVTFRVTLKGTGRKLNAGGIRVTGMLDAGTQTNWDPPSAKNMTLVGTVADSVFAITLKLKRSVDGKIEYKFINGTTWGAGGTEPNEDERGVPAACAKAANDNRVYTIVAGATAVTLPVYKFNTCDIVTLAATQDLRNEMSVKTSPNPFSDVSYISFDNASGKNFSLSISDVTGRVVRTVNNITTNSVEIKRENLATGVYYAVLRDVTSGKFLTEKLVVQ